MATRFRADHVGSLLRPAALLEARAAYADGQLGAEALRQAEDSAVREAIRLQRDVGLEIFTDGEYRHSSWLTDLADAVEGFVAEQVLLEWYGPGGGPEASPARVVGGPLRQKRRLTAHEVAFLEAHAPGPIKMTVPCPSNYAIASYNPGVTEPFYPSREALLYEVSAIIRREVEALVAEGVAYVQMDAPFYASYLDPAARSAASLRWRPGTSCRGTSNGANWSWWWRQRTGSGEQLPRPEGQRPAQGAGEAANIGRARTMARLAGKVAVITGGAGGIGRAAARVFTEEGAHVLLVDLNEAALQTAVQATPSQTASYVVADTTQPDQVQRFVNTAVERYGGIDVFLANAGIEGALQPIPDYPIDVFDQVMAVNVRAVWLGLKYVIPVMRRRGGGSIVITSSTAGIRGGVGMAAYTTSKHAVIGLMRSAALECAPLGIRVNTVNPAPIETRMMRSLEEMRASQAGGTTVEQIKQGFAARIPLKRYGAPEEVARLMLFLASDESSFCTGGVYMVDGGSSAGLPPS
jgi:NAD(P)-dependent dehydrogenase (short-subunit alcohol dehydrogenase family)